MYSEVLESKASIEHEDLETALRIVKPHEPKIILEVGMWKGFSSEVFIKAFNPDLLITLERDHKHEDGVYFEDQKYHYLWDVDSGSEDTLNKVKNILDGKQVDFLFIDGGHLYSEVRKDILNYMPLVKDGGIIAFHDILYFSDACQVNPHWENLKKEYDYVEINRGNASTGFGIVFKNKRDKIINKLHE